MDWFSDIWILLALLVCVLSGWLFERLGRTGAVRPSSVR